MTPRPAALNPKPHSSTARQHQALVISGRNCGFDLAEIRRMVGGSIRRLSVAEAAGWISRFKDEDLPNPPGGKRSAYPRHQRQSGVTRIITQAQVEQIDRMLGEYFGDGCAAYEWLNKNFKVGALGDHDKPGDVIRRLATAQRAGEVIRVLKQMVGRRGARGQGSGIRAAPVSGAQG